MKRGIVHMIQDAKAREHFYREALLHGTLQALNLALHVGSSSSSSSFSSFHISWRADILTMRCLKDFGYFLAAWVWSWTLVCRACPYPAIPSLPCQVLAVLLPALAALHNVMAAGGGDQVV